MMFGDHWCTIYAKSALEPGIPKHTGALVYIVHMLIELMTCHDEYDLQTSLCVPYP